MNPLVNFGGEFGGAAPDIIPCFAADKIRDPAMNKGGVARNVEFRSSNMCCKMCVQEMANQKRLA